MMFFIGLKLPVPWQKDHIHSKKIKFFWPFFLSLNSLVVEQFLYRSNYTTILCLSS